MACPATFWRDVLNSRFSPVSDQPARRIPLLAYTIAFIISLVPVGDSTFAQPQPQSQTQTQTLEDCVERLAGKAVALPHERRMSLVWTNHAALSGQRAENLRSVFAARLEGAQVRLVQGEAAPALLVSIEQTPSQIVFTATVPAEGCLFSGRRRHTRSLVARDAR